jgi:hypothetical protein
MSISALPMSANSGKQATANCLNLTDVSHEAQSDHFLMADMRGDGGMISIAKLVCLESFLRLLNPI